MLTLSPSRLDAFRYYLDSEQPFEEYLAELKRERPMTPDMQIGRDFHLLLEDLSREQHEANLSDAARDPELDGRVTFLAGIGRSQGVIGGTGGGKTSPARYYSRTHYGGHKVGTTEFDLGRVEVTLSLPDLMESEVSTEIELLDGERCRLNGIIDAQIGTRIIEYKTTKRTGDRYFDSMQWRAYLLMVPEAHEVRYEIFQFRHIGGARQLLTDHTTLSMGRYPRLEADVVAAASAYFRFLRDCEAAGHFRLGADGKVIP